MQRTGENGNRNNMIAYYDLEYTDAKEFFRSVINRLIALEGFEGEYLLLRDRADEDDRTCESEQYIFPGELNYIWKRVEKHKIDYVSVVGDYKRRPLEVAIDLVTRQGIITTIRKEDPDALADLVFTDKSEEND